jgi:hypothetical protein
VHAHFDEALYSLWLEHRDADSGVAVGRVGAQIIRRRCGELLLASESVLWY